MEAAVVNGLIHSHLVQLKGGTTGNDFKGRARRIFTTDNLVIQRVGIIIIDTIPILRGDTMHKKIGVIAGTAHHGAHSTITRVQCHHCRGPRTRS